MSLYCEDVQGLFLSNLKENSTAMDSSKQFFQKVKMID
jgi:hypothetical protein